MVGACEITVYDKIFFQQRINITAVLIEIHFLSHAKSLLVI